MNAHVHVNDDHHHVRDHVNGAHRVHVNDDDHHSHEHDDHHHVRVHVNGAHRDHVSGAHHVHVNDDHHVHVSGRFWSGDGYDRDHPRHLPKLSQSAP